MQRLHLTSLLSDCCRVQRSFLIQNSFLETGCIFLFCPTGYRPMKFVVLLAATEVSCFLGRIPCKAAANYECFGRTSFFLQQGTNTCQ